jgi:hypothetical protein
MVRGNEMRKTGFAILFGFWPLFWGVLLPYFRLPGGLRLLNFFWSIIDGLGLWAIDESVGLSIESRLVVFGVFVWPIAISVAMFLFGFKLLRVSPKILRAALSALLASSLLTVSLGAAQHPPISNLPTFYRFFFAVW